MIDDKITLLRPDNVNVLDYDLQAQFGATFNCIMVEMQKTSSNLNTARVRLFLTEILNEL